MDTPFALLQASDELLLVGESNLLVGARRAFVPLETASRMCSWAQILACMALNVVAPDRTWYFRYCRCSPLMHVLVRAWTPLEDE